MQNKTLVFWGLAIIICLSLLAGCSTTSVTTSSTSSTQSIATTSQNAVVNIPSFADLINLAQPCVVEINVTATSINRASYCPAARGGLGLDNGCEWHDCYE